MIPAQLVTTAPVILVIRCDAVFFFFWVFLFFYIFPFNAIRILLQCHIILEKRFSDVIPSQAGFLKMQ